MEKALESRDYIYQGWMSPPPYFYDERMKRKGEEEEEKGREEERGNEPYLYVWARFATAVEVRKRRGDRDTIGNQKVWMRHVLGYSR